MLERADLPGVCRLHEAVVRSGSPDPPPHLVEYFERTPLGYGRPFSAHRRYITISEGAAFLVLRGAA